jgi:spore coat protein U-like protein
MTRVNMLTAVATIVANADGSCLSKNEPVPIRKIHAAPQTPVNATSTPTAPARRSIMRSVLLGVAAALSICTGSNAQANTPVTGSMTVSINIIAACTVSATTLSFGNLTASSVTLGPSNATATISVTCASTVPYAIGLGEGLNYASGTNNMKSGGNTIAYALYTDSGHSNPWLGVTGTACSTASECSTGTGSGSVQNITVYGQVATLGSAPAVGSYTDTVTVTVDY